MANDTLTSKTMAERIAERVVLEVCELPDYNSPEDQPDLVMCTVQELNACVLRAFEQLEYDREMERGPPAHETECVGCGGLGSDARPFQLACKVGHIGPFKDERGYYEKRRLPPAQKAVDVPVMRLCAVCEGVFIDHRHGAMGHDWQPKPQSEPV